MKSSWLILTLLLVGCSPVEIPKAPAVTAVPAPIPSLEPAASAITPSHSPSPPERPIPTPYLSIEFTVLQEEQSTITLLRAPSERETKYRPGKAANYVFHSEQEMKNTWNLYFPDYPLKAFNVDFSRETVAFIYSGGNPSYVQKALVSSVVEYPAEIVVNHYIGSPQLVPAVSGVAGILLKFSRVRKAVSFVKGPDVHL